MQQIKADIFNKTIPLIKTIQKYFKFTTNITKSENNIAYMNDTCKEVAKHIRTLQCKESEYEVGEVLVCREYFKSKQITFNVNFEYEIISVSDKSLTIKRVCNNATFEVPITTIRSHFIFSYCGTAHSQQGASIDSTITIFDYKHFFITAEWLWVAITRATELDNVYFYDYTWDEEFNRNLIQSYFGRKVKGYASHDREAKREIDKNNYVNVDWLMAAANKRCRSCRCDFYINFDDGNTYTNITAQRLDNSKDHNLDNIVPMCKWCNCCKSNK